MAFNAVISRLSAIYNHREQTLNSIIASINEENGPIIIDQDKQPYDELEPNKSFELALIVHYATASKFHVQTEWTDGNGEKRSKVQMGDL